VDNDTLTIVLVALVMAVGLIGTVLPFVPGLPLIWGAALVYGLIEGFGITGLVAMAAITVVAIAGMAAKIVLPQRRATTSGAPKSTLLVGSIAGIIGFFVIPIVGLPVGAVAGVYLAEYWRTADPGTAWRSTKQVIVGFGLGALFEMSAGIVMIVSWVVWVLVAG
jgi:uncharacterized protein YqgC (DUF456 family)